MASGPISSWETDGAKWKLTDFIFGGSKITVNGDCSHETNRCLLLGRKVITNLDSVLKPETSLYRQMSEQSKLWFSQLSCTDVRVGPCRRLSAKDFILSNSGVEEDS